MADRCLTQRATRFRGRQRRRQLPPHRADAGGGIAIVYDVGQGQGWQRNIVMNGRPHLPSNIRQWYGDSRGHWEGDTLVIDVTNFSPKTDVRARARTCISSSAGRGPVRIRSNTGHDRRSDRVDAAVDRKAGVHQAERAKRTESTMSRAASKETSGFPRTAAGRADGRASLRRGAVLIRRPRTARPDTPSRIRCNAIAR